MDGTVGGLLQRNEKTRWQKEQNAGKRQWIGALT